MWKVTEDDKVVWQLNRDETQGADQLAVIEYSPGMSADELYTHVVQAEKIGDYGSDQELDGIPESLKDYVLQVHHDSVPFVLLESKKLN